MASDPRSREHESAFAAALGALRRRERTVAELSAWLEQREIGEELVAEVIGELVEAGELDDERFARAFAEDKRELSGWGPERIEGALADRGLPVALIEEVCAGEAREQQLERAVGLLRGRGEELDGDHARARALAFLNRRGYGYEVAYDAVRAVTAEPA